MTDGVLMSVDLGGARGLHIATLSDEVIVECGADHLGVDGYFLFETCDVPGREGIIILGKCPSFDSALFMADFLEPMLATKGA